MTDTNRRNVPLILENASGNDEQLSDQLLPLVYDELRRLAVRQMAKEPDNQTIQPTVLVHEAYLRLVGDGDVKWESRGHFYAAAARSMRQILVNRALHKKTHKRGGDRRREPLEDDVLAVEPPSDRLLALNDALNRLEDLDPRLNQIVMLRYFAGLTIDETAKSINLSAATVSRDWRYARAWLAREIATPGHEE